MRPTRSELGCCTTERKKVTNKQTKKKERKKERKGFPHAFCTCKLLVNCWDLITVVFVISETYIDVLAQNIQSWLTYFQRKND